MVDQIRINDSGSHEDQLPKKDPIQLEKETFVGNILSIENNFFPSSNLSQMEMGTGVRDAAICLRSIVLGDEENNMPMVIFYTEGAGIISTKTDKINLHQGNCFNEQITVFEDPLPLQINDSLSDQEIKDKASNVLKLRQLFGVDFEGCDKTTFHKFLRIDQKMGDLRQKKLETTPINTKNTIPKEIRNLEFSC